MSLVSVVIPSYNHEMFIAETIESILGQDVDDLELIIVDDASTDVSRDIIQKYAVEDSRIRVILHEENYGIAKSLNDGIAAAQGKFLAYIASDDVWMKDKLSKQLAALESNEDLIIFTGAEIIDETGRVLRTWICSGDEAKSRDGFHNTFVWCQTFSWSTLLHKRENLSGILFDEHLKYAHDIKFYLDLAARYEFHYVAEPLVHYRIHSNNLFGFRGLQGGEATQVNHQENVAVLEYVLGKYHHRMSANNKATALDMLAYRYFKLGQIRKALMCNCKAFAYDPFRMSNLQPFFGLTRKAFGRGRLERK